MSWGVFRTPPRQPPRPAPWIPTAAPAVVVALDDDGFVPPRPQVLLTTLLLLVGTQAPSAALGIPEEDFYQPPSTWKSPAPLQALWLDDEFVATAVSAVDDDAFVLRLTPVPDLTTLYGPWFHGSAEDFGSLVDDQAAYQAPLAVHARPKGTVWLGNEEIIPQATLVEDEPFLPHVRQPSISVSLLYSAQGAAVGFQAALAEDEYHAARFLPPPEPTTLFGPWSYGVADDLGFLPEEEYQYSAQVRHIETSLKRLNIWLPDECPAFLGTDEDFYLPIVRQPLAPLLQFISGYSGSAEAAPSVAVRLLRFRYDP